jgi:hypothetical protein
VSERADAPPNADQPQDVGEQLARDGDLGHLEGALPSLVRVRITPSQRDPNQGSFENSPLRFKIWVVAQPEAAKERTGDARMSDADEKRRGNKGA